MVGHCWRFPMSYSECGVVESTRTSIHVPLSSDGRNAARSCKRQQLTKVSAPLLHCSRKVIIRKESS